MFASPDVQNTGMNDCFCTAGMNAGAQFVFAQAALVEEFFEQ